jgi:hypothetical protein
VTAAKPALMTLGQKHTQRIVTWCATSDWSEALFDRGALFVMASQLVFRRTLDASHNVAGLNSNAITDFWPLAEARDNAWSASGVVQFCPEVLDVTGQHASNGRRIDSIHINGPQMTRVPLFHSLISLERPIVGCPTRSLKNRYFPAST